MQISPDAAAHSRRLRRLLALGACAVALSGCAALPRLDSRLSRPDPKAQTAQTEAPPADPPRLERRVEVLSTPRPAAVTGQVGPTRAELEAALGTGTVEANLPPQPLPQFVRAAFQDLLGVSVGMGPSLAARTDLVSLATKPGATRVEVFEAVRDTLKSYGVQVLVQPGFALLVDDRAGADMATLFARGRELPPETNQGRPVIFYMPIVGTESAQLANLLRDIGGQGAPVSIENDGPSNSLILRGMYRDVDALSQFIRQIDRPGFEGAFVARVQPVYWGVEQLADQLISVMSTEGWQIARSGRRAIVLMPIRYTNQLIIFAQAREGYDRALEWIDELDQPAALGDRESLFIYDVRNTSAQDLLAVVQGSMGQGQQGGFGQQAGFASRGPSGNRENLATPPSGAPAIAPATGAAGGGGVGGSAQTFAQMSADPIANRILFRGTAIQFRDALATLEALDRPVPQVLIEVTIAEVTLTDETRFGIEWLTTATGRERNITVRTEGGLGLAGNGIVATLTGVDARAALQAIATNNNVNVLSTPRVLTRSGQAANFQVGTDVPVITSQRAQETATVTAGRTDVLQTVEYRRTGVILSVTPTVYADRVDLDINQEVSSTSGSATGGISSPTILTRNFQNRLTLRDGETTVLAGLMSNNVTRSNRGVPFAKDLPIVGNAFKTQGVESTKTELVVMVTPRIADDDSTTRFSQALTDSFNTTLRRSRFGSYTLTPWGGVSVLGGRAAMRSEPKLDAPRPAPAQKSDD